MSHARVRSFLLSALATLAAFPLPAAEGDARLWLSTDLAATFTVDGNEGGTLLPGSLALLEASPGRHVLVGTTEDGQFRREIPVEVTRGESRALSFDFASLLAEKLRAAPSAEAGSASEVAPDMLPPQLLVRVSPEGGLGEGLVVLEAVIDEQGHVRLTRIRESVPALDAAAVRAVSRWRYAPARHPDGRAQAVRLVVKVDFRRD